MTTYFFHSCREQSSRNIGGARKASGGHWNSQSRDWAGGAGQGRAKSPLCRRSWRSDWEERGNSSGRRGQGEQARSGREVRPMEAGGNWSQRFRGYGKFFGDYSYENKLIFSPLFFSRTFDEEKQNGSEQEASLNSTLITIVDSFISPCDFTKMYRLE